MLKDLEQAPPFAAVAFRMQNAFPFEIHIIDQRVTSVRRACHSSELLFDIRALGSRGFVEHFGERVLQTRDHKLRLKIDSVRKKLPELAHLGGVLRLREFRSRVPRARARLIEPTRKRRAAFVRESEKLRETLFERAFHAFGIPNEMANSERSKIFSRIPRGQARNTAVAFVLPNAIPDSKRVRIGNVNWLSGLRGGDQSEKTCEKRAGGGKIMVS